MTTRRLAAILAADVVGFSSMMEKDEEGTPDPGFPCTATAAA
jgi:class 3 adenylate cyclase